MNKKQRILTGIVATALLGSIVMVQPTSIHAATTIKVTVNSSAVAFPDQKPYLDNNRVLIPARFVSVALGGSVDYKNKVVTIKKQDGTKITMKINSAKVSVGGKTVTLDVPAKVVKGRTVVPLRFVSEALGASVDWNQTKSLVSITTGTTTTPTTPTTPTTESGNFKFDPGFTDLAKVLFVNNMKIADGKITFTVPEGSTAGYSTPNGKRTELNPGQTYSYAIGKGAGYLNFKMIIPSKIVKNAPKQSESYMIDLDSSNANGNFSGVNDAIVSGYDSKVSLVTSPLSKVLELASSLK